MLTRTLFEAISDFGHDTYLLTIAKDGPCTSPVTIERMMPISHALTSLGSTGVVIIVTFHDTADDPVSDRLQRTL